MKIIVVDLIIICSLVINVTTIVLLIKKSNPNIWLANFASPTTELIWLKSIYNSSPLLRSKLRQELWLQVSMIERTRQFSFNYHKYPWRILNLSKIYLHLLSESVSACSWGSSLIGSSDLSLIYIFLAPIKSYFVYQSWDCLCWKPHSSDYHILGFS